MPRDASIPLFLWIATAVLVHLVWGGGADRVAQVIEERLDVGRFAASVRQHVRSAVSPPIEVTLEDDSEALDPPPEAKPEAMPEEPREEEPAKPESQDEQPREPEPETPAEKEAEKDEEQEKEPEERKKEEPEKKEPVKVPELELPKRVAVRQFVKDQNQEDNPNARHLADHANHVQEETQARVTSNTENSPDPNPGSSPTGAGEDPGNATETRVAHDRDAPGEARAPNETPSSDRIAKLDPRAAPPPAPGGAPRMGPEPAPRESRKAEAASEERAGMPETLSSEESAGFSVADQRAASAEQKAQAGRKARELPKRRSRKPTDMLGLGAAGVTANGVNLNVTPSIAAASIGTDELSRLKRADGERRRSAHRGKFKIGGIERWRSAIENYVPSVKQGNQTALNTARAPFASYLSSIHNRLHPIFADGFLASLDSLPGNHPMNQDNLSTNLEIVLDREEGKIVKMGVTKFSGVTAFDVAALESVSRAAPFGTPPGEIVSPDGNVYLHWEFHRNLMACSTYNARPYMLKVQPKSAPPPPLAPPALPPLRPAEPAPGSEKRHGSLERPRDPSTL